MRALSIFGKHVVTAETHPSVLFLQKVYFEKKNFDASHQEISVLYSPGMLQCYNTSLSKFCSVICQVVAYMRLKRN